MVCYSHIGFVSERGHCFSLEIKFAQLPATKFMIPVLLVKVKVQGNLSSFCAKSGNLSLFGVSCSNYLNMFSSRLDGHSLVIYLTWVFENLISLYFNLNYIWLFIC